MENILITGNTIKPKVVKKMDEMEEKFAKQVKQNRIIFFISLGVLVLFIVYAVYVINNRTYYSVTNGDWSKYHGNLAPNELGDFLAGTAGILIALLNAYLLYRTIKLQAETNMVQTKQFRKAIRAGNKQFRSSLNGRNIDTALKLIEFHKSFLLNETYEKAYSYIKENLDLYARVFCGGRLGTSEFHSMGVEPMHPYELYLKKQSEVDQLCNSAMNIVDFIETNIDESEKKLYHTVFFNSLSHSEKY